MKVHGRVFLAMTVASAYAAVACSADSTARNAFDGIWQVAPSTAVNGGRVIDGWRETMAPADGSPLPLQPWNQALHAGYIEQAKKQIEWAPNNQRCLVAGTVRAMKGNYAWRWMTTNDAVVLLFEEDNRVNLFRFREAHPANLRPSWAGDAIARWDGDTLIVDVTGFNGKTPFPMAIFHTTLLHVVHHFRLTDGGSKLEDRVSIDDPGAFTRPFEVVSVFNRQPDTYKLADYRCAENNQDMPRPNGWWAANWGPG